MAVTFLNELASREMAILVARGIIPAPVAAEAVMGASATPASQRRLMIPVKMCEYLGCSILIPATYVHCPRHRELSHDPAPNDLNFVAAVEPPKPIALDHVLSAQAKLPKNMPSDAGLSHVDLIVSQELPTREEAVQSAAMWRARTTAARQAVREAYAAHEERATAAAALQDEVVAGLRERGWPEPADDNGNNEICWRGVDLPERGAPYLPCVWLCMVELQAGYETADDMENATLGFDDNASVSRIIEAIDRLGWVIGLPNLPTEIPSADRAYLEGIALSRRDEIIYGHGPGMNVLPELRSENARREAEMAAGIIPEPGTSGTYTGIGSLSHPVGQAEDEIIGLRPLSQKPEPAPAPPFVPNKWGEHGDD